MSDKVRRYQNRLNGHGFPCGVVDGAVGPRTRAATLRFQQAWAGGLVKGHPNFLARDGIPGPQTLAAASFLPRISPHFSINSFRCKHCGLGYIRRELIVALEAYRGRFGGPISIISGYRCPTHNRNVGGASQSMHTYAPAGSGCAADINGRHSVAQVQSVGRFSGIGYRGSDGRVIHVDTRGVFGRPGAIWRYGR